MVAVVKITSKAGIKKSNLKSAAGRAWDHVFTMLDPREHGLYIRIHKGKFDFVFEYVSEPDGNKSRTVAIPTNDPIGFLDPFLNHPDDNPIEYGYLSRLAVLPEPQDIPNKDILNEYMPISRYWKRCDPASSGFDMLYRCRKGAEIGLFTGFRQEIFVFLHMKWARLDLNDNMLYITEEGHAMLAQRTGFNKEVITPYIPKITRPKSVKVIRIEKENELIPSGYAHCIVEGCNALFKKRARQLTCSVACRNEQAAIERAMIRQLRELQINNRS